MLSTIYLPRLFFLIIIIFISTGFCTPKPKPKAQPKPLPKAEPKAKPDPKAKPQFGVWYESKPVGMNNVGGNFMNIGKTIGVTGKLRLQYHLKSIALILQKRIASGKMSNEKVRTLMANFIKTAVGGSARRKAGEADKLQPTLDYSAISAPVWVESPQFNKPMIDEDPVYPDKDPYYYDCYSDSNPVDTECFE